MTIRYLNRARACRTLRVMFGGVIIACCLPVAGQFDSGRGNTSPRLPNVSLSSLDVDVADQDGKPLERVRIQIKSKNGESYGIGVTDLHGRAYFPSVARGSHEIVASFGSTTATVTASVFAPHERVSLRMQTSGLPAPGSAVSVQQLQIPERARKEMTKAYASLRKKDSATALEHIDRALTLYPPYAEALAVRAQLKYDTGDPASAISDLSNALSFDPNQGWLYVSLICVYNNEDRFADAEPLLARALSLSPNHWATYYEVGRTEIGLGSLDSAWTHLQRAESLGATKFAPLHLMKAYVHYRKSDFVSAKLAISRYLELNPEGIQLPAVKKLLAEIDTTPVAKSAAPVP